MASKVEVKVSVDGGEFKTGLLRIKQSAMDFKSDLIAQFTGFSVANLFMTGIASAIDFLGKLAEEIGRIKDKAEQFGVSMREWQVILNGARNNGGGDENVIAFFDSMTKARQEAINGNEKYQKSFRDLGISIEDLKSKNNDELFYAIADGVKAANGSQKAYYDTMVIGRGGAKELFNALSKGGDVLREEGESLGIYSDSMIKIIDEGAKQWEWLWSRIKVGAAWVFAFLGTTLWAFYDLFRLAFHGIWDTVQIIVLPIIDIFKSLKNTVMGVVYSLMALGAALTGNLAAAKSYAKQSADSFKKAWKNATDEVASDVKGVLDKAYDRKVNDFNKNYETRDKIYGNLFFGAKDSASGNEDGYAQTADYTDYAKIEELQAKLDSTREKYAFEQLDSLGKIKNLETQIAELKKDANEETEKGLNASLKILELEKQLASEKEKVSEKERRELADLENRKKQLADAERQQAFDQLSTLEKTISLEAQIAEEKRKANSETKEGIEHSMKAISLQKQLANENQKLERQREQANKSEQDYLFSKMSKEEQIALLKARADELRLKMNDETESGFAAKTEFYANQRQLDSLLNGGQKNGAPNVIASSLAAIGAGGNVYAQSFSVAEKQLDESKKHTKSLDKIAENAEILTQKQMGNGNLLMR